MRKFILIIFGDIDFNDDVATIWHIYSTLLVPYEDKDKVDEIAENHCEANGYDGYVAPQLYGEVIFKTV